MAFADAVLRQLAEATRRMRSEQKAYFSGDKTQARLNQSKAAERTVDKMLAEIEAKGLLG